MPVEEAAQCSMAVVLVKGTDVDLGYMFTWFLQPGQEEDTNGRIPIHWQQLRSELLLTHKQYAGLHEHR